ncbi:hypothetical protein [Ruegeria hyattellae]|uniref:hypothetical protein n=1 Tax=Ruegeria hyattellae TaxID=3233337 RepID=UPI00355C505F
MSLMVNAARDTWFNEPGNDYHLLPVTDRQMQFATAIAARAALEIPPEARRDRRRMSEWISADQGRGASPFDNYPSGKQVSFAERLSRQKRRPIPHECFRDKSLMSNWIDRNR